MWTLVARRVDMCVVVLVVVVVVVVVVGILVARMKGYPCVVDISPMYASCLVSDPHVLLGRTACCFAVSLVLAGIRGDTEERPQDGHGPS